jgi:hypothetical protein
VNSFRDPGAQFGLQARARAAVLATADEIRPDDVPPVPAWLTESSAALARRDGRDEWNGGPGFGAGGPRYRADRWTGRWGVPLAAAAAVAMAAGVTATLTVNRIHQGVGGAAGGAVRVSAPAAGSGSAGSGSAGTARPVGTVGAGSAAGSASSLGAASAGGFSTAAAAKPALAAYPADLTAGLIGMFVPATGAQYSAGAALQGEYKALESQVTSACMTKAGFQVPPVTSASIASQDWDLTRYPDLNAIAKAGTLPGDLAPEATNVSGSPAFMAAYKGCNAASDKLFTPMVTAGLKLGGPFLDIVRKIQGSAPVLATTPALRACAAKYGLPLDPYGPGKPINSFADFVAWVSGQVDGAGSSGVPSAALHKLDAQWASVFVRCARPTVTVMEKVQLVAQQSYLASHKEQFAALVTIAKADFAKAGQLARG